jgi:hypothetical protein
MARAWKIFNEKISQLDFQKSFWETKNTNAKTKTKRKINENIFFSKVFYSKMIDIKNKNKKVNAPISIPFIIRKPFR